MTKLLWTFEKEIAITTGQAESILFNIREGRFAVDELPFLLRDAGNGCTITGKNNSFAALFADDHKMFIETDYANHNISIQGEWWFKALYSLVDKDNKTILNLSIYNVAEKFSWAAQLMNSSKKEKYRDSFYRFADRLQKEFESQNMQENI